MKKWDNLTDGEQVKAMRWARQEIVPEGKVLDCISIGMIMSFLTVHAKFLEQGDKDPDPKDTSFVRGVI